MEPRKTRIVIELENDGSEKAALLIRNLLKEIHHTEQEWENRLGEESAFLTNAVRFEVSSVNMEFHQTGQPLRFADEQ